MKNILATIKKFPALSWFIILCVIFVPVALITPAENNLLAIVTTIGVDKEDNEYEVSVSALVPTKSQDFTEKYKVISGKGHTIGEAIENIAHSTGKSLGLIHTEVIVLGKTILDGNVEPALNLFLESSLINNSVPIITTNVNAKEVLELEQKLENETNKQLGDLIEYANSNIYFKVSNLESFYDGLFSESQTSCIGLIEVIDTDDTGMSAKDGGSSGQSQTASGDGEQSQSKQTKSIATPGKMTIFKKGKQIAELTELEMKYLSLLNPNILGTTISADSETKDGDKVRLSLKLSKGFVRSGISFDENNIPKIHYEISNIFNLLSVENENLDIEKNYSFYTYSNEKTENSLKNDILVNLSMLFNKLKENNLDILNFYDKCYAKNPTRFKAFLKTLENPEDFLKYIKIEINYKSNVKV